MEPNFLKFSSTLYEERWKEVMDFLKEIRKPLQLIRRAWSLRRWFAGVDGNGIAYVPEQRPLTDIAGAAHGRTHFNPQAFHAVLQDPMTEKFISVVTILDTVPDRMTRQSGACPCHYDLLRPATSRFQREKLMTCHYGSKWPCPLAGAWAPEYAAGKIQEVVSRIMDDAEADILEAIREEGSRGADAITQRQIDWLLDNWRSARDALMVYVLLKLNFFETLPWLLFALAHHSEETARAVGRTILAKFEVGPRQEAHDKLTWKFLGPSSFFQS